MKLLRLILLLASSLVCALSVFGQGTIVFQNLDFENGTFAPVPGDPYNSVQWSLAMPGWTGYIGTNQSDRLLHNNLFLSLAGIAIQGPNYPSPNLYHGQHYVVLQAGLDPNNFPNPVGCAITQTGTIPSATQSIRLLSSNPFSLGFNLLFGGNVISLFNIGNAANGRLIWGGDVSSFAGQTGELRFQGSGSLDFIQFSNEPIPEPSVLSLFGLGGLFLGWQSRRDWNHSASVDGPRRTGEERLRWGNAPKTNPNLNEVASQLRTRRYNLFKVDEFIGTMTQGSPERFRGNLGLNDFHPVGMKKEGWVLRAFSSAPATAFMSSESLRHHQHAIKLLP